jgi:predicted ATPase/DNA-binding XRE family transcriptional regulator
VESEGRAPVSSDFGALLRRHRLAAGLSQEALAERAGMSAHGVSALERGYRRTPQFETLALLARALALDDGQRREFAAAASATSVRREGSVTIGPWSETGSPALPVSLTSFVGREAELDEIRLLVRKHRMVTLTGAGGVGKTRTASQFARTIRDSTHEAVCFVGFAPVADPSLVVATIASALGVQDAPNLPLLETLRTHLRNKAVLLVLDNCEHLIERVSVVAETLLDGCPRVRILATSREALRAAGEHAYSLPSLSVDDAADLFADRARAVDHHFALNDKTKPLVAQICGRLDGIPLAIELAAARANVLSLDALTAKLGEQLGVLSGGSRTGLPRHQAMRATIEWSYNLLSRQEQVVFERLSIFAGGCTLEAATIVCATDEVAKDGLLEPIASLVGKSLVIADLTGNEPRYRLLESFREFGRERLTERGEDQIVAHRHARACLNLVKRLGVHPDLGEEKDNLRAALQWALFDRGDVLLGQQLVGRLGRLGNAGPQSVPFALKLVDERTPKSVLAMLKHAEAETANSRYQYRDALASSRSAVALYREVGDALGVGHAQILAGHQLLSLEQFADAKHVFQEALELARELDDRLFVADALRGLSLALLKTGDDAVLARGYLTEAISIYKAAGPKNRGIWTLDDAAEFEFSAGDPELALHHAMEMLSIARRFNLSQPAASARNLISIFLIALGRFEEAEKHTRESLEFALDASNGVLIAYNVQHLAVIATLLPRARRESARTAHEGAAQLLGFVDSRLTALGSTQFRQQQQERDRSFAALCDTLGRRSVTKLMAVGAAMTEDQAIADALRLSQIE